jgi:signal transduction histidine kinase
MTDANKPASTPSQRDVTQDTPANDIAREGAIAAREENAALREEAAGRREGAADLREETSTLREEAVRAREEAAHARSELEQLLAQLREANERLVVGTVRAQTMTEDAEQANHLKDEFLATVSHELRTPLNAVLGWARMLRSKQLPADRARHAIATIERNASALAHLIDDLLDVSRIVAGTLHLAPQAVDLGAVAQAAVDAVQPLAASKNVRLTFSPDRAAIDTVTGDAGRLQQIIWNLLANAVTFPLIMLGGSFFPFEVMPEWMARIGKWTPNGWSLLRLREILDGNPDAHLLALTALGLFALGGVLFALALKRMSRFARTA